MPGKPKPQFSCFISHGTVRVTPRSPIWQQQLPLNRSLAAAGDGLAICYGEYFSAVRAFLENRGCELICRAIREGIGPQTKPVQIRKIHINLEKHGEFYHPAHLEVFTRQRKFSFVLNVAVSEAGIRHIMEEYFSLEKLNNEFEPSFLPRVYGIGEAAGAGNRRIRMFLGQWFEGYHEFHLTLNPSNNKTRIAVWHPRKKSVFLSFEQSCELYRQASRILTHYYHIGTFAHIYGWHHAAGDFVVRVDEGELDLKLITVRRYIPLFPSLEPSENASGSPELILQALLIFLLNLSIRMRVDRLDGVGDMVWADSSSVGPALEGFMEGLDLKPPLRSLPASIGRSFRYYLSVCSSQDLHDLTHAVAKVYKPDSAEHRLVVRNIDEHVETLSEAIQQFINQPRPA